MKTDSILGIKIHKSSLDELIIKTSSFLCSDSKHIISFLNPELVNEAFMNKELKSYYNNFSHVNYIDGIGIILVKFLFGKNLFPRNTGTDFMHLIAKTCQDHKKSIYYLGGKKGIAEKASNYFRRSYKNLKIAGTHHGYFKENEEQIIIEEINNKNPDVIIVCLGFPRQECFIKRNYEKLSFKLIFANGGALDYYANSVSRAPKLIQLIGFEWAWRLFQDFNLKRIKRQLKLFSFVVRSLVYELKSFFN